MILIIFVLKIFNRYVTVENKMKAKLMNNLKLIKSSRLIDPTFYVIGLILDQGKTYFKNTYSIELIQFS